MIEFDEAPLRPFHRRLAVASTAGVFADGYGLGIIGIALSLAAAPLALDALWLGLIGGASLAGLFLGALLTGPAADRYGRRPIFAANMPLTALLALLQFAVHDGWQLLSLRLAIGFLLGTDYVVSKALLIEFVPRRVRGRVLGTLSIAWAGGYACAYAVGFALSGQGADAWRWMLLTSALPCLAIVPPRLSMPESPLWLCRQMRFAEAARIVHGRLGNDIRPPLPADGDAERAAATPAQRARWRQLFAPAWRQRTLVGCTFFACQVMPYFAVGTFVAQLMTALHLHAGYLGGLFYNLALLGGAIAGVAVVDRLPRRVFLIGSFTAAGLAMAVLTIWTELEPALMITLFALFAGILSAASNMVYVYLPELFPTELRASGIGLAIAASRVGSAISTFLLPLVVAHYGVRSALGACVAVLALGALICQRWAPETRNLRLGALSIAASAAALVSLTVVPAARAADVAAAATGASPDRLARASIAELRAAMAAGELSAEQLVRHYLERIERLDQHGPRLNALLTLNPAALEQARALDRSGEARRGLLSGIPFIAKDNFDTAGLATSGGAAALKGSTPVRNAFVIQRLLDQGAILIGKSNMSELAASYGRLGYSSAGGLTLNPYNTRRNASGSSSGSAAAVAADFAVFALGTDASGSVRAPANVTGLVGIRPTLGLVSRAGIMPASLSFDTAGVLARSVEDAARVLVAIAGADPNDAATLDQPLPPRLNAALPTTTLAGVRLGVITNFRGGNDEVDRLEQHMLERLRAHGAVLIPLRLPAQFEHLWESVLAPVSEAEFKPQFERYLATLPPGQPRTLAELITLSASAPIADSATPVNPARLESLRRAEATPLTDSALYIRLLTQQMPTLRAQLQALIAQHRLRALVFSTMSCPASPRFDQPDPSYLCRSDDPYRPSYIASATGFPELSVSIGMLSGQVPSGLSLLGLPYHEAELLALARALQSLAPPRPVPALSAAGRN